MHLRLFLALSAPFLFLSACQSASENYCLGNGYIKGGSDYHECLYRHRALHPHYDYCTLEHGLTKDSPEMDACVEKAKPIIKAKRKAEAEQQHLEAQKAEKAAFREAKKEASPSPPPSSQDTLWHRHHTNRLPKTSLVCTLQGGHINLNKWRTYDPTVFILAPGEQTEITVDVPHRRSYGTLWGRLSSNANVLTLCQNQRATHTRSDYYRTHDRSCAQIRGIVARSLQSRKSTVKENVGIYKHLKNATLFCQSANRQSKRRPHRH